MSFIFFLLFLFFLRTYCKNATYLTESSELEINPNGENLEIFCYNASLKPSLNTLWLSATLTVKGINSNSKIFIEHNEKKVKESYDHSQVFLVNPINFIVGKIFSSRNKFSLNPFNASCLGVVSLENYVIELSLKDLDPWLFVFFLIGIILFLLSDHFSKSIIFYYASGIFIGIFGSVLLVAIILSRYFPNRRGALFTFVTAGISLNAYIWEYLRTNLLFFLQEYFNYIMIYILITGLISFAICYYKGPISNPKGIDILRWFIRFLAIVFIHFGCNFYQISLVVVFSLVLLSYIDIMSSIRSRIKRIWMIKFPKKRSLLTEDEYLEQASVETYNALQELRSFCRSPQCDAWKVTSKLSSPGRFAQWVEGSIDHVTEEELFEFDTSKSPTIIPSTLCYYDD